MGFSQQRVTWRHYWKIVEEPYAGEAPPPPTVWSSFTNRDSLLWFIGILLLPFLGSRFCFLGNVSGTTPSAGAWDPSLARSPCWCRQLEKEVAKCTQVRTFAGLYFPCWGLFQKERQSALRVCTSWTAKQTTSMWPLWTFISTPPVLVPISIITLSTITEWNLHFVGGGSVLRAQLSPVKWSSEHRS